MSSDFVKRLKAREALVGYWVVSDNAVATERIARAGYDYVCLDMQHGLLDYAGCLQGLMAINTTAGGAAVRVPSNDPAWIGRALDAGADAVIVPLVDSVDDARRAAQACLYPPTGVRSYGPLRSGLRIGPAPREADEAVACIVMIETQAGLDAVEEICGVPGVSGIYVGPSDLSIALGAQSPGEAHRVPAFGKALERTRMAAEAANIAVGLHCPDGQSASRALEDGFTFVSISNDLNHLDSLVRTELARARGQR